MTGREKMLRYDRKRKNAVCDRKILIRRSLDVFLRKRGMTRTAGARHRHGLSEKSATDVWVS